MHASDDPSDAYWILGLRRDQGIMDVVMVAENPYNVAFWDQIGEVPPDASFTMRPMQPWRDTLDVELQQYNWEYE